MTDGRRHSLDIPITRTLIALRRVRSLRDPSTNSMSKFSSLLDNVNWETNSSNGISLRFENSHKGGSDHKRYLGSEILRFNAVREERDDGMEMHCGLDNSKLMTCQNSGSLEKTGSPCGDINVGGIDSYQLNRNAVHGNESVGERYCSDDRNRELDLACILPTGNNSMEDVGSCKGPIVASSSMEKIDGSFANLKHWYNRSKLYEPAGDVGSRVSSPYPSVSDALSNHNISFAGEEVDVVDSGYRGCGLSCYWSRTPRFKESNPSSDVEDRPLLSDDVTETTLFEHRRRKCINNEETAASSETPRSLSQKFRPNSFDELVGQNVVVRSLLSAISRGMVTSFYLFHGPRGTGKTSASRIFAAALNCLSLEEHKPCGICRECILFFSGRSRDVKEVDSLRINRTGRARSLIKSAFIPPLSSRFKIFIVDECQLLQGETWVTLLNSLENISQQVVFVMITPDLDKLPRSAVSRSQKYHFPKIKDVDIASRLRKICIEEALNFDQVALDFIAAKSSGSIRDAEMMLDQLSLLGKKITMSLAYELIGVVSDDELLNLLDLALSSDTSNTVIKARELMRSKIDPMQLISQLANLIMDILAGKCQGCSSEARKNFFGRHASEADMQKLRHALKILSETEKQLRMSKHQSTWLTVALLQLNSVDSSSVDLNGSKSCSTNDKDCYSHSTSSPGESLKHLVVSCSCDDNQANKVGKQEDFKGTLESIWRRATELCQSNSLKCFLRKQGKLYSLHVNQGLAVVELQFHRPDYVSRAERSWKLIASSLQSILGCNVEIRLLCAPISNCHKTRKLSFSWFSCSGRIRQKFQPTAECGSDSDYSHHLFKRPMIKDRHILTFSSHCGSQILHNCYHGSEVMGALRSSEGNVLSTGTVSSHESNGDDTLKAAGNIVNSLNQESNDCEYQVSSVQGPENQPSCFPRALRLQKKLFASETSQMVSTSNQQENKLALSIPKKASFDTCICANDPCIFYGSTNNCNNSFRHADGLRESSDVLCWGISIFPRRKVWRLARQGKRSNLVECILPCTTAK